MPLFTVNYLSPPLGIQTRMIVIQPDGPGPFPVVYQLHGRSDDCTAWQRWTTIEHQAQGLGLMVVLLDGGRSFYSDTPGTNRLWASHILHAVDFVDATFRTIPMAASRGIGGLSMGGFGALKLALRHPDRFASAVSHSGALDMARWYAEAPKDADFNDIWPTGRVPAVDDVRKLLAKTGPKPAIHIDVGTEDFLLAHSRTIAADLKRRRIPHAYAEHPGSHNWAYWQAHVGEGLAFHAAHLKRG